MKNYEIHHEVGIAAKPAAVYKALTEINQLSKWWTATRGSPKVGGTLEFWFNDHVKLFKVKKLKKNKLVLWKVKTGDGIDWGTGEISFELSDHEGHTVLHFSHTGWKKKSGDLAHCTTKWGVFMLSLKSLLEKGKGQPFPKDVQVS
jgi:uncharacterized protein YndB with AHSA1/START domain